MKNTLGETIKQIRIKTGLSQQGCADLMHVDRSTIANWETGRRLPNAEMLRILSQILDTDFSYLMNASLKQQQNVNVIMVDDEKIILTGGIPVISNILPNAIITGFTKPSESIAFARDNIVSIAFIDIEMGKISGLDLCRNLLAINPQTNVIFLTSYMEYSFDAWDTGASGFLLKPLSNDAVTKQLSKLRYPIMGGISI
ncbi:MAG: response regulator [Lachnospiraceae bacterium]|nr:response regulator [Lachnospiraceae bacterium]